MKTENKALSNLLAAGCPRDVAEKTLALVSKDVSQGQRVSDRADGNGRKGVVVSVSGHGALVRWDGGEEEQMPINELNPLG